MSIPSSALPRPRVLPAVIACVLGAMIGVVAGLSAPGDDPANATMAASHATATNITATIALVAPGPVGR